MPDDPITNGEFRRREPNAGGPLEDIFDDVEQTPGVARGGPAPRGRAQMTARSAPPLNLPGQERAAGVAPPPPPLPVRPVGAARPAPPLPAPRAPAVAGVPDILSDVERSTPVVQTPRGVSAPTVAAPGAVQPRVAGAPERPVVSGGGGDTDAAHRSFPTADEISSIARQPPLFARKKFIILLVSLVLLAVLVIGAWGAYVVFFAPRPEESGSAPTAGIPGAAVTPAASASPAAGVPPNPAGMASPTPVPGETELDSDHDGLPDKDEQLFGTNIFSTDTDSDDLSDRDEVKVFDTDPKNPDSDGDGFEDGTEVRNGYNPKGPGKIKEVPQP